MTTLDATALIDSLRRYRLLEPEQLAEVSERLYKRFPDAKDLGRELLQRGWLTAYQVNQLLAGRGRDLVLGSHVLLERLGEGGMGQVFKARHATLGRIVALKVIRKERLADTSAVRRFHREIRAAAHLEHPNIVRAIDADDFEGTNLLVMEYVEGGCDLSRLVKLRGPLPVSEACALIRQAALGLQHAHERGLVHRDIKPQNLLLAADGKTVKILDMGLARVQEPDDSPDKSSALTQEGSLMGTPDYIAPEQALSSHHVDIRADIYSLGCTLYYLLTGKVPFPGGSLMEKLLKHQSEQPRPVESLRPEVPAGVAAVVRRMMAKRPEDRFQTPAELIAALEKPDTLVSKSPTASVPSSPAPFASRPLSPLPSRSSPLVPHPAPLSPHPSPLEEALSSDMVSVSRPGRSTRQLAQQRKLYLIAGAGGGALLLVLLLVIALAWRATPRPDEDRPDPVKQARSATTALTDLEEEGNGLDAEGFLVKWLLLAPIPLDMGETPLVALAKEQIPDEANLRPRAGDRVQVRGKELVWGKYTTVDYYFNFNHFLDRQVDYAVGYAVCYIRADADLKDLKLKIGSDDEAVVYLNGKRVLQQPNARPLLKDQDTAAISLRNGVNALVFKVINEKIEWTGCARFMNKDGRPVVNIKAGLMPR